MVVYNNILAGASGATGAAAGYQIDRSLRFNSADSAYLNRTPSSAGNRKIFTWSGWVKRTAMGADKFIFSAGSDASNMHYLRFKSNDTLEATEKIGDSVQLSLITSAVYRDPSAWYHIVYVYDSTQSTAADRLSLYINGAKVTTFGTSTYPSQNHNSYINSTSNHFINARPNPAGYADTYLADVHFIDGQALAPTDFGEYDDNNIWQPKEFASFNNPNDGTTWSDLLSPANGPWRNSNPKSNGFDGSSSTSIALDTVEGTLTFSPNLGSGSFVVEYKGFNDGQTTVDIDGTTLSYSGSDSIWTGTVSSFNTMTMEAAANNRPGITYIKVNGYVLLDDADDNSFKLNFSDNSSSVALGYDAAVTAPTLNPKGGMDVVTYTGTGSTQTVSGLGFQPDFVWIKSRTSTADHELYDSVRGATKRLFSSLTNSESTQTGGLTAFNSNGFTLGGHGGSSASSTDYVAWAWKAGGTASSNTDGTLTSQVSASTDYGFSIVSYTSDSSAVKTVGHGLGSQPRMIFFKDRDAATNWFVHHNDGSTGRMFEGLNTSSAGGTNLVALNDTLPTSSVFTVNSGGYTINPNGNNDMIAYCWSEVSGFSKISSYTGNGGALSVTGFGFKPRFLLIRATGTGSWMLFDSKRGTDVRLKAQTSDTEASAGANLTFDSDGFSLNTSDGDFNGNGSTYIYAAFADRPGNNFDVNNLSVAAGADNDSLLDTPTNYEADSGNNGGNYCTWNSVAPVSNGSSYSTFSNGNLEGTTSNSKVSGALGTIGVSSGKWYYEITCGAFTGGTGLEIGASQEDLVSTISASEGPGDCPNGYFYINDGRKVNNSSPSSYGASYTDGDVIGVALDLDNSTIEFFKNGVSQGDAYTNMNAGTYFPAVGDYNNSGTASFTANFGQRAFAYTAPSGFKALCTTNLDDPLIADGSEYFDISLYTGNGGTQSITGLSFQPDFVWTKQRNYIEWHALIDVVRGGNLGLASNSTNSEETRNDAISSFNADGYSIGDWAALNQNTKTFVSWAWDAGTSTASNTDGTITSSVRASQTAGFSVLTYTGTGANNTIGHGLNAAPEMILVKRRNSAESWGVYHVGIGNGNRLSLNSTDASTSTTTWNSTTPTSSVFSVGVATLSNGNNDTYVAYCFAPVAGYSAFGSYEGNGNADGPFIYTGFRPAFILFKITTAADDWIIFDTARATYNRADQELYPNLNKAEEDNDRGSDILSNGFKIRTTASKWNTSGATYIYAAFAENPFQANGGLAR